MRLKKLLPETLGGEPHYNYWNQLLMRTIVRWIDERNHRPFVSIISKIGSVRILEIGVARGWGAERMVKAAGVGNGRNVEYYGFDLFCKCAANKFVSTPMHDIERKLMRLGVKQISLFAGDSRETLPNAVPTLPKMDVIYIDGGHSYEICQSDWENVQPLIHPDTVVIFDDYHDSGVKHVVDEIENPPYQVEILRGLPKAVVRVVAEKVMP